ncbi:MAG: hypothetical protein DCC68_11090 [Planctomycetota bacterium]|nr:MAG: hypothetical protein DCC68_11090 [Planctomycetota bacterium]
MGSLLTNPALETLLEAAILAPSGDNTQPWRFIVDEEARTIDVEVDEARDRSPMNAGQRMARIACGAAIENMVRTAEHNCWPLTVGLGVGDSLAKLTLHSDGDEPGQIDEAIKRRVTNRHFYDRRPIDDAVLANLMQDSRVAVDGVRTHWIIDRRKIAAMAAIIGEADAIMFGIREMRRAFLDNIRFDLPRNAEADEGLPTGSLGLNPLDHLGLKLLRYLPDWVVRHGGVLKSFRNRARALVESAAGLCVLTAEEDSTPVDIALGRQLQRRWLDVTECGLAAQPMMSVPVLDGWTTANGNPQTDRALQSVVEKLEGGTREVVGIEIRQRIAAIVRFGHPGEPHSRTGRRNAATCSAMRSADCRIAAGLPADSA